MLKCCPCPNQAKVQSCSRRLIRQRSRFLSQHASPKDVHNVERNEAQFDRYLDGISRKVARSDNHVSLRDLYQQYLNEAGSVLGNIVPYEERPSVTRRADRKIDRHESLVGDGLVLVVHASLQDHSDALLKTTVCSGFVVNASLQRQDQGDTIITCAHTLNEITRYRREEWHDTSEDQSFSFIVTSFGQPRVVTRLLSSMPRSDTVALEVKPLSASDRLRSLPLSPYPVYNGTRLLTHLFGSSEPPSIQHSVARTKFPSEHMNSNDIEQPQDWLGAMAYRRWGPGHMLGYRSYTGVEIEVRSAFYT